MTESLNMGTLSKTGPGTPEAYKQHWPDEDDPSKMPNPLQIGPPTYMMIIMTHILTLMKTGSKEETDETKYIQHLKRSQNNPEATSLSLIHACQMHLMLSTATLSSKSFGSTRPLPLQPLVIHKRSPYHLMHNRTKLIVNYSQVGLNSMAYK